MNQGIVKSEFQSDSHDDGNEIVTKGFLRQELQKEFAAFELRIEQKFEARFAELDAKIDRVVQIILREIAAMREENREFRQMREQLYASDVRQEIAIEDLSERVLLLEAAS